MPTPLQGSLADRDSWFDVPCSAARALDVLSSKSTWILLREVYYGSTQFQELARQAHLSEPAAAARLKEMVAADLLAKVDYQTTGQRTRQRYVLTDRGTQLLTSLFALMEWGDRHLAPDGGPVRLQHRDCGAGVHVELHCNIGHTVQPADIDIVASPATAAD